MGSLQCCISGLKIKTIQLILQTQNISSKKQISGFDTELHGIAPGFYSCTEIQIRLITVHFIEIISIV